MVPETAIVVHSTKVWMLTVLSDLFLLIQDQRDWIKMARLHVAEVSSWMTANLLPINVFHLFDGPCIHVNTMDESVHK
jgi:hypothetical protein